MPSNSPLKRLRQMLMRPANVTVVTAIAVAIPTAYAFHGHFPGDQSGFLLLFAVGVGVPGAFDSYGPDFEQLWDCVFATLWVCAAVVVAYIGIFAAGLDILELSPFLASTLAFLCSFLGPVVGLAALT